MDSILVISNKSDDFTPFLERLGYLVSVENSTERSSSLSGVFEDRIIDLIVLDGESFPAYREVITFLRNQDLTSLLPIVILADPPDEKAPVYTEDEKIEFVAPTSGKGVLASRVAMLLRLGKNNGKRDDAHISEMNAALRDFTEKVSKDLEEAQAIQLATLPKSAPISPHFDIAFSYDPLEELGGDWFYVQEEIDGTVSLMVADVTGHGLAAAFIGAWLKLALWGTKDLISPDLRLAAFNQRISPLMPDGRFITMSCVNYNPQTHTLLQARAGHPPTVLYRVASDQAVQLMGNGFALGFFEEGEYELVEHTIAQGDIVVICTDGVVEAQNMDSAMYGADGIDQALRSANLQDSSLNILEHILADLDRFTGGRLIKDDVTILVLKCLA